MLNLGHLVGWAAGGPVAEAVTPATNTPAGTAAPADADAAALAASFGALIDDFAADAAPAANGAVDATDATDGTHGIDAIDAGDHGNDDKPVVPADAPPPLFWLQALTPGGGREQVATEKKSAGRPDPNLVLPQDINDDAGRDDAWPMLLVTPLPIVVTPLPIAVTPPAIAATPSAVEETPSAVAVTPSPVAVTSSPLAVTPPTTAVTPSPLASTPSTNAHIEPAPTASAAPEMSQPIVAAPDARIATDAAPTNGGEAVARAVSFKPEVIAQSIDVAAWPVMDVAELRVVDHAKLPVVDVAKLPVPSADEFVQPADKKDRSVAAVAQYAGATGAMASETAARSQDMTGDRRQPQPDQSNRGLGARAWGHVAARYRAESASVSASASTAVAAPENAPAATLTNVPHPWQSMSQSVFQPTAFAPSLIVPARIDHARTAESRAETLPEGTTQQIVQSLRVVLSRGGGDAHIRLDPRQFGDLSVSIRVDGGHVVAQLQAETPAVREWLHANQQTLRQGLAEQDLRLERLEIFAPADETRDETNRDRREQQQDPDDHPAHRARRRETGGQFEFVA